MCSSATRSRIAGSRNASGFSAFAVCSSVRRSCAIEIAWPALPTRSWPSAPIDTSQPLPSSPSRSPTGIFTSSKNTSQNSESPVISRIGRMSMPGSSMSTMNVVMPSCLRPRAIAVGSVRMRNRPHFAICADEIHVFCPFTT